MSSPETKAAQLCTHKALGDEPDKFPDSGVWPDQGEVSLYTCRQFGCVHWEDKDERRLPRI